MATQLQLQLSKTTDFSKLLFATERSWTLFVIRLALAVVIFPHGAQKLLGWFGGFGFEGTMGFFTDTMGIPYVFGFLAIVAEFFGAIALASGFLSRIAALGIGVTMLTAMLTSHIHHGFFINWYGNQAGEGFEFFLLAIGMAIAVVIGGGGAASADRQLFGR